MEYDRFAVVAIASFGQLIIIYTQTVSSATSVILARPEIETIMYIEILLCWLIFNFLR